jgi:hypothetical protein
MTEKENEYKIHFHKDDLLGAFIKANGYYPIPKNCIWWQTHNTRYKKCQIKKYWQTWNCFLQLNCSHNFKHKQVFRSWSYIKTRICYRLTTLYNIKNKRPELRFWGLCPSPFRMLEPYTCKAPITWPIWRSLNFISHWPTCKHRSKSAHSAHFILSPVMSSWQ